MLRILGIDPGIRFTGYGLVQLPDGAMEPALCEAGVLKFKPKDSLESRLAELYDSLSELMKELQPTHVAIEQLYAHYKHPRTSIIMGHARGVILLCAQQQHLVIEHLKATEIKKAVTGHGHASKEQIQLAIQTQFRLPEPPEPPDVADALAIALCYARRVAYERL